MKVTKSEYIEVYEDYIQELITQQAQLVIEINSLVTALDKHRKDYCKYHLTYNFDEETGVFSYIKGKKKRIGF